MVIVPLRIGFEASCSQILIKGDDVQVRYILELHNLSPGPEEFHESGIAFLAVNSLAILTNFHTRITEVKESKIARPQSFQLVWDAEDVDVAFIHHVENNLPDINHQLLQRLIQLDSINAVSYCTTVPLLR